MGYCTSCGRKVEDIILYYDSQTGEPIYHSPLCDDCAKEAYERRKAFEKRDYEREMEELRDQSSAGLIDKKTAFYESYRLRKKYNL